MEPPSECVTVVALYMMLQPWLQDRVLPRIVLLVATTREWVLLAYRIPREPSTPRISVWRKLRRLGAVRFSMASWGCRATRAPGSDSNGSPRR